MYTLSWTRPFVLHILPSSDVNSDSSKLIYPTAQNSFSENNMRSFRQGMSRIILNPESNYRIHNTAMLPCLETVYSSPYSHFVFHLRPTSVLSPHLHLLLRSDLLRPNFPINITLYALLIFPSVRVFRTPLLPSFDHPNNRNMRWKYKLRKLSFA
jgi:hypothetical protein